MSCFVISRLAFETELPPYSSPYAHSALLLTSFTTRNQEHSQSRTFTLIMANFYIRLLVSIIARILCQVSVAGLFVSGYFAVASDGSHVFRGTIMVRGLLFHGRIMLTVSPRQSLIFSGHLSMNGRTLIEPSFIVRVAIGQFLNRLLEMSSPFCDLLPEHLTNILARLAPRYLFNLACVSSRYWYAVVEHQAGQLISGLERLNFIVYEMLCHLLLGHSRSSLRNFTRTSKKLRFHSKEVILGWQAQDKWYSEGWRFADLRGLSHRANFAPMDAEAVIAGIPNGSIPEEFLDPIRRTIMRDPVMVPNSAGMIVDRATYEADIFPHTDDGVTSDMLVTDERLKARIEEYIWTEYYLSTRASRRG